MKKVAILAVLLCMICFSGCGARQAVTEEAFTAATKKLGYVEQTMTDETSKQAASAGIETIHMYRSPTEGGAAYYFFTSSADAHKNYADALAAMAKQAVKVKQVDSSTYNFAQYETETGVVYAIRTDNTFLYINDMKDMARELMTELGY